MFARDISNFWVRRTDEYATRLENFSAAARRNGGRVCPAGDTESARAALAALGYIRARCGHSAVNSNCRRHAGAAVQFARSAPTNTGPRLLHLRSSNPELVRRPEWLQHPNGSIGCKAFSARRRHGAAIAAYDRLLGLHEVTTTDALASVRVGAHRVVFLTPDDFATIIRCSCRCRFSVARDRRAGTRRSHRDATADYLAQWQIRSTKCRTRLASRREANGTVLFFSDV